MHSEKRYNPFRMMLEPRKVLNERLEEPTHKLWWLALFVGWGWLIERAAVYEIGYASPFAAILLVSLILAIPAGYLVIYAFAACIYWVGKIFQGKSTFKHMVRAVAFAHIPQIFAVMAWVVLLALFQGAVFTGDIFYIAQTSYATLIFSWIQIVLAVWIFILLIQAVSEVHEFPSWIAVCNLIATWIFIWALYGVMNWIFGKIIGAEVVAIKLLSITH